MSNLTSEEKKRNASVSFKSGWIKILDTPYSTTFRTLKIVDGFYYSTRRVRQIRIFSGWFNDPKPKMNLLNNYLSRITVYAVKRKLCIVLNGSTVSFNTFFPKDRLCRGIITFS